MQNYSSGLPSETKTQVGGLANNVAALLAYLPCTALIASIAWLVTEPKSNSFLRFHAIQSLIFNVSLAVLFIGFWIVVFILQLILGSIGGSIGSIIAMIIGLVSILGFFLLGIAALGGVVMCMLKSYQGQMWKLPVVGELADKYARS